MTFELAFQTLTTGLAGLACWFLYDLVREFKSFKSETKNDIFSLKQERINFKNTIIECELSIASKVSDMKEIYATFTTDVKTNLVDINGQITDMKNTIFDANKKVQDFEGSVRVIFDRLQGQDNEIEQLRLAVRDFLYYK